jgi:hypothetical protein
MSPSFRIGEWLTLRRYSRAQWYRLKAAGNAPDTIGTGRMTRITPDADVRWLKAQERKAGSTRQSADARDDAAA